MASITVTSGTVTAQVRQQAGASLTESINAAVDAQLAALDLDAMARAALEDTDVQGLLASALVNQITSAVETRFKNAIALAVKTQVASVVETRGAEYIAQIIPQVFASAEIEL